MIETTYSQLKLPTCIVLTGTIAQQLVIAQPSNRHVLKKNMKFMHGIFKCQNGYWKQIYHTSRTYCPLKARLWKLLRSNVSRLSLKSKTWCRAKRLRPTWIYSRQSLGTVYCALSFTTIKRDDFNFHITNFSFLSSNIQSSPAQGVFISHIIQFARTCSSYECFILGAVRLSNKLLGQVYVKKRLKSSLRKFYGR